MKKRKYLTVIILTVIFCQAITVCASVSSDMSYKNQTHEMKEPENLYALSACLMDADSGRVLFEKEGCEHRANASTTKILTLILTLEHCSPDEIVDVSRRAARQPEVKLHIKEGEQYRLEDLCYSLMLESHNDAAVAIAEHVGGSVEGFAKLMNEKAQEIGCENSYFITPNGLDEEDENGFHGTSAVDLARIMRYCISLSPRAEEFLKITRTSSYTFSDVSGKNLHSCNNHNAFLQMMDGVLTGKTGFTNDAGYCYVAALKRDERTFIVALLGCGWPNHKTYKWSDSKKLFTYGIENYNYRTLEQPLGKWQCAIENGAAETGNPYDMTEAEFMEETHDPIRLLLRSDEQLISNDQLIIPQKAPVERGQDCGAVLYYLEEKNGDRHLIYSAPVYAVTDVCQKDYRYYLKYVMNLFGQ